MAREWKKSEQKWKRSISHLISFSPVATPRRHISESGLSFSRSISSDSSIPPLEAQNQGPATAVDIRDLLLPMDVAFACKVSVKTVFRWLSLGKLQAVCFGARIIRITQASLNRMIDEAPAWTPQEATGKAKPVRSAKDRVRAVRRHRNKMRGPRRIHGTREAHS